jgi:hypothetical protein
MAERSDDQFAAELLGTDVLVGVTMVDHTGRSPNAASSTVR